MTEVWKKINGWDYEISDKGRVKSPRGRIMRPGTTNGGYLWVTLCANGERYYFAVHRLVCHAFKGPCPDGMECAHENGIATDNRASNLSWKTRLENAADKVRHGTDTAGERNPRAKISEDDVRFIRELLLEGRTNVEVADMFNVSPASISNVRRGATWRHVN